MTLVSAPSETLRDRQDGAWVFISDETMEAVRYARTSLLRRSMTDRSQLVSDHLSRLYMLSDGWYTAKHDPEVLPPPPAKTPQEEAGHA